MATGDFYQQKSIRPGTFALVIAAHAAAIVALGTAKIVYDPPEKPKPLPVTFIPEPPVPEPEPLPRERPTEQLPTPQRPTVIDRPPQIVPTPPQGPTVSGDPLPPRPFDALPPGPRFVPEPAPQPRAEPAPPPAPPVRTDPAIDPRHARDLQPPYPASEERAGNEGRVVVRVTVGTDGRVKDVERVSATSDAFWRATERHARGHWRFRPATLDGRPVESRWTMTVNFRLTN